VERVIGRVTEIADRIAAFDFSQYSTQIESVFSKVEGLVSGFMGLIKTAWEFRGVIIAIAVPLAALQVAFMGITAVVGMYNKIKAINNILMATSTGFQMAYAIVVKNSTAATAALAFVTNEAATATGIWSFVMNTIMKIQRAFIGRTIGQTIALTTQTIATKIATSTQWAFNTALTANPIGVVIMAIAALIAIIVLLVKNWNKITAAVKNNTEKIMFFITLITGPLGFLISMIKEVVSNFGRIKEALAATGLFDKIKEIGEGIKNTFGSIGKKIVSVWNAAKDKIADIFSGIGEAIMSKIGPVINRITNAWHTATSKISGIFKGAVDTIYTFIKPGLDWFGEKWQQIVLSFKDNAIINAIKVIGGTLLSGLLMPMQGLLEILSHIPKLGHLAGKGAQKIEEIRNSLKGIDKAAEVVDAAVPDAVQDAIEPPAMDDYQRQLDALDMPSFGMPDASKLHGVVDISKGPSAITHYYAALPGTGVGPAQATAASPLTQTVTSAVSTPAVADNTLQALLSIDKTVQTITALIQSIDTTATAIFNKPVPIITADMPALRIPAQVTRTPYKPPPVPKQYIKTDKREKEDTDQEDPRHIPPVSREERMAYSLQERRETVGIEVSAAQGSQARIVRRPKSPNIKLTTSGGNA
jgi:hypothetical protein